MERKSLLVGTVVGTLFGSLAAGGAVYASTTLVQAQRETATYANVKGTALVYGGTTYAELYAVQQALKQQGVVNGWNGKAFVMDSPSQSNKTLASENEQLNQQIQDSNSIFKNIGKVPTSDQQSILSTLSQNANSSSDGSEIDKIAKGLQNALSNTAGNPGNANSTIQNILNGYLNGHSDGHSHPSDGSGDNSSTTSSVYGTSSVHSDN